MQVGGITIFLKLAFLVILRKLFSLFLILLIFVLAFANCIANNIATW